MSDPTNMPTQSEALPGAQADVDGGLARATLYQLLARAFDNPAAGTWPWLTAADTRAAVFDAVRVLEPRPAGLKAGAAALLVRLHGTSFASFQQDYTAAFGHAARGNCPLNEIDYGEPDADPLFQPHRLADLAAFYRAFGLEVADDAAERPDHLGMELEFMAVLATKEAYAAAHGETDERCALCRDAQRKFLREHLGRWAPAFARRLARAAADATLAALADFTHAFVVAECHRFGVPAGREDLALRPVDEAGERLCAACGLDSCLPGANAADATA